MKDYDKIFSEHISQIKSEGRYREFKYIARSVGEYPFAYDEQGEKITLWCINDYLAMGQNPKVIAAAESALNKYGAGSGGTRNIGGSGVLVKELEQEVASLHGKDAGLIFTSGFVANDATLTTLAKIMPDIVFFSDEDNHASIISGICNSKAEKYVFKHGDIGHLEQLLKAVDISRPKLIAFESIYSMDGVASPIEEICALARKYNALTYLDEVHTVGLYGEQGAGLAKLKGVAEQVDIIQGTLGKAFGVVGGYIAASEDLIDAIRSSASGFIFTTTLPPAITAASLASIRHLRGSDQERVSLHSKVSLFKSKLQNAGVNFLQNDSHIIPIIIGEPNLARQVSEELLKRHRVFVQHINFPTVPRGTERIRLTLTPAHTEEIMDDMVTALADILLRIGLLDKAA